MIIFVTVIKKCNYVNVANGKDDVVSVNNVTNNTLFFNTGKIEKSATCLK